MNSDIKIKKSNCPSRTAAPVKRFNISKKWQSSWMKLFMKILYLLIRTVLFLWGKFWLSGNFWLVSFKISYLCLPLFYETRTTPSCHPSGCAYRQLWYCQFRQECWPFWYLSWWKKSFSKIDFHNVLVVLWTVI